MPFKDPKKMADYMRKKRAESRKVNMDSVNPVNPKRKPVNLAESSRIPVSKKVNTVNSVNPLTQSVNPAKGSFLLSYSRNKYQFVLYSVDSKGNKSLMRSCKKNDVLEFGPCRIQLTWGPEVQ